MSILLRIPTSNCVGKVWVRVEQIYLARALQGVLASNMLAWKIWGELAGNWWRLKMSEPSGGFLNGVWPSYPS